MLQSAWRRSAHQSSPAWRQFRTSHALPGGVPEQVTPCLDAISSKSLIAWRQFRASCPLPGAYPHQLHIFLEVILHTLQTCCVLPTGVSVGESAICLEATRTRSLLAWMYFLTSRGLPPAISVCTSAHREASSLLSVYKT